MPAEAALRPLSSITFDDVFVRSLPADPVADNRPRQVRGAMHTPTAPTPVRSPRLLAWSDALAATLGIARPQPGDAAVQVLAGNALAPGMRPYASRYGGHQFGNWAGQLGDGRAITLGELRDAGGGRQELQLKGAGPTPYSRTADGRAVLRSSVREFLCSEAMHWLGVPTTRALSLVATGEEVVRDMFYDGNPAAEPGAVVCRVAPSFLRFGHFEILAANGEHDLLRTLIDHTMGQHFPGIGSATDWFAEVCRRTAVMLAQWLRVGFVHGVMNTDNMSILGLTIDYGPYGWLEGVDPLWTPNTTDASGRRYCFGRQAQVAHWNLARLAGALDAVLDAPDALRDGLATYGATFNAAYRAMLADKLGVEPDGVDALDGPMWSVLTSEECDFTLFFRNLPRVDVALAAGGGADDAVLAPLRDSFYSGNGPGPGTTAALRAWLREWAVRTTPARLARMDAHNPKYVLRNWLAQQAIDAATAGDCAPIERLLAVLRHPFDEQPEHADLAVRRPEWARNRPGCSALSCSS
jgi:uncharacterized protein YdiU (UPF0061 family)